MKFLIASAFLFIKITVFPTTSLLAWMALAIIVDFITGVAKAVILKQARKSSGYRKTITKFLQYGGALFVGLVLANTGQGNESERFKALLSYVNDGLVVFIIYIEVTSIFENLYACDQKTTISKYFIAPALKILTWQIKNNPVMKEAEKLETSSNQQ